MNKRERRIYELHLYVPIHHACTVRLFPVLNHEALGKQTSRPPFH